MERVATDLDALAKRSGFSGVVRLDLPDDDVFVEAYGLADRAHGIPNRVSTRFGVASVTKGFTALTVVGLIERGALRLETTARSLLGGDLPLIDDAVTVEQLLGHRSGIGDYFDEEAGGEVTDYALPVPVHQLLMTEDFLSVMDGFPTKFSPDSGFAYCNGGFVVLALLAERAAGRPFHDLVQELVCRPAGMGDTSFLRSDELPGDAARGYLFDEGLRTNVLHLPVRGNGDGGIYSTAADLHALWDSFLAGRIVSKEWVTAMIAPRSDEPRESKRYGLGFWIHGTREVVWLEGYDAGVSCRTMREPATGATATVIANSSEGAWDLIAFLEDRLWP